MDRDGTLNEMVYDETHGTMDSPRRPEQVRLRAGAAAFLRGVRQLGYEVIVVTNQPGIAKGTLTEAELEAVHRRLAELLAAEGAAWDAIYWCPHHPSVRACSCRKPKPGLLRRAARERQLRLRGSWMVGDGVVDVQAGRAAGCWTLFVGRLKPEVLEKLFDDGDAMPDAVACDLAGALEVIRRGRRTNSR
ncbi:MAG: HAD-IIIA family hydrolase [Kiritimatiellae bacterium]|nr:HAD-IIIA family hydrolase [Kiritimatiellia bacterium]